MKKLVSTVLALLLIICTYLVVNATIDSFTGRGNSGSYGPTNKDWRIYGDEGGGCGTVYIIQIYDTAGNNIQNGMDIIRPYGYEYREKPFDFATDWPNVVKYDEQNALYKHYNWYKGGFVSEKGTTHLTPTKEETRDFIARILGDYWANSVTSGEYGCVINMYSIMSYTNSGTGGYRWGLSRDLYDALANGGGISNIASPISLVAGNLYYTDPGSGQQDNGWDQIYNEPARKRDIYIKFIDQDGNLIRGPEYEASVLSGSSYIKQFYGDIPGYPEYNDLICTFFRVGKPGNEVYGDWNARYTKGDYCNVGDGAYTQTIEQVNEDIVIYAQYRTCKVDAHYYVNGEKVFEEKIGNFPMNTTQTFSLHGSMWSKLPGYENYLATGSSYSYGGNNPQDHKNKIDGYNLNDITDRTIYLSDDVHIYVNLDAYGINVRYIDASTHEVIYRDYAGAVGDGMTFEYWAQDVPLTLNGVTYSKCLKSYYVDGDTNEYVGNELLHKNVKIVDHDGFYVRYQDLLNVSGSKTIYFEYERESEHIPKVTIYYKRASDMHSEYNSSTCLNTSSTDVKNASVYYFKEGTNLVSSEFQTDITGAQHAGISLPSVISAGESKDGREHKLSASYILGLSDGEVWHVDGNTKTRNPGVINNDITVIAEYNDPQPTIGEQITVTVYYKQDIGGHANYNSSTCLKQSSTNVPNASTAVAALNRPASATEINIGNPTTYKFPKGTDISGINAIPLPGEIGEYKLSASYLLNLDGVSGVQYHVGSGYTKRSPDILNYDLTIIAEYGKNVEVDTVEDFEMEDLDNNARGLIASERKDSQLYDVYNGIPTHEEVYANAKANEFLYNAEVQKVSGNRDYTVKVTVPFSFSWKCSGCECGGGHDLGHNDSCKPDCKKTHTGKIDGCTCYCSGHSGTASHTFTYTINREFSYWTVNSYQIYRINTAYIENSILVNSGNVQWNGNTVDIDKWINTTKADHLNFHFSNTFATSVTTGNKSVVLSPGTSADYDVSTYDFESNWNSTYKTNAEAAVPQIQVKNDKLIVNGETIVAGETWQDKDGTRPNINKQVSGDKEFDKRNIQIPIYFKNKKYDTTQSRIRYVSQDRYSQEKGNDIVTTIKGFSNKNRASDIDNTPDINMVNDVIVHTPVYIRAELSDDQEYNQKINISDEARNTIVLDKEFTINFWLWGQHRNIDGYGNNNYSEYMKDTEIKVPFDVYIKAKNSNSYQLLSANTWYNIESYLDTDWNGDVTFKIPVWVDEGLYVGANSIMLRVIAENDQQPSDRDTLGIEEANKDGSRKIYSNENVDYRAYWHIPVDVVGRVYNFKLEYTDDPSFENTMNTGFAGESIDQLPFPEKGDNILNQYYTYAAKLGYKFKFSLSTKGTKSNEIEIIPHFYYVSKKAANGYQIKEEDKVDVYYTNSKGNKELLNSASTFSLTTNLTKEGELPYIESDLITNTRNVLNAYKNGTMRKVNGYGPAGYWYNYNSTVGIGTVGKVILNEATRLRYDNIQNYLNENTYGTTNRSTLVANAGSENNIVSRISNWYGEYRLPSTSTFVKGNKTIEEDGYVIVYFEIKTNYNDGTRNEYLSYQLSNSSTQYQKEGWQANRDIELPNGRVVKDLPSSRNYASVFIYEAKLNNGKDTVGTH